MMTVTVTTEFTSFGYISNSCSQFGHVLKNWHLIRIDNTIFLTTRCFILLIHMCFTGLLTTPIYSVHLVIYLGRFEPKLV